MDWYEAGRRDGAQGQPAKDPAKLGGGCGFNATSNPYQLYSQGRNAGLSEYCTPDNAFHIGKTQLSYNKGVCPAFLETEFLSSLARGQKVSELERENHKIEQQIESLTGMTQRSPASSPTVKREINTLVESKRKNEDQIRQLVE